MIQTAAFLTDTHDPFRDVQAHNLAVRILKDVRPDMVILGSDGVDCYRLSKFDKNPARRDTLQSEIDTWVEYTREIKAAVPNAKFYWIPGNHENRLTSLIWRNPALFGLRALEWSNLLQFKELGIERAHKDEVLLGNGRIVVKHGNYIRGQSGRSAWAELNREAFSITTVSGHSHRFGAVYRRTRLGMVQAYEGGCLCTMNPEYTSNPDWHQGFVLLLYSEDGAFLEVDNLSFTRGRSGSLGVLYRGEEFVEDDSQV